MGLPGAGKTTLASKLVPKINAKWLNADEVRKKPMIGIFLTRVERGKQKEWLILLRIIKKKDLM